MACVDCRSQGHGFDPRVLPINKYITIELFNQEILSISTVYSVVYLSPKYGQDILWYKPERNVLDGYLLELFIIKTRLIKTRIRQVQSKCQLTK